MKPTKRALVLSALALAVIYLLTYIEENFPRYSAVTRSVSTTSSLYEKQKEHPANFSRADDSESSVPFVPRWKRIGQRFARSFYDTSSNNRSQYWWCTQDSYDKSCRNENRMLCNPKGLLFVKTPKTGSTTISKIVKKLVDHVARRSKLPTKCQHREDHIVGAGLWYGNRDPHQSFLMASARDPAERAMSRFFWSYVTRHTSDGTEVPVTDEFILNYLNTSTSVASGCTSKGQGGYQLNYVTMSPIPEWSAWNSQAPTKVLHPQQVEDRVQQTLLDYDFILLNERMEESLVVLKFLLGLQTGDIVSLSYNVGGSYRYEKGKCKQLIKSHISDGMKAYFQSEEWQAKSYGDYLLVAAVNHSIDLTIDQIGRRGFDLALQEFRRLEAKVNEVCTQKVPFPCSSNGTVLFRTKQPIPHGKIARCIDEVVLQEQEKEQEGKVTVKIEENWHL